MILTFKEKKKILIRSIELEAGQKPKINLEDYGLQKTDFLQIAKTELQTNKI